MGVPGKAYSNRELFTKLANEFGYKGPNVISVLLPRLKLSPPHTDENKIRAAIRDYQAKHPRATKKNAGPPAAAPAVLIQNYRSKLVAGIAVRLFPTLARTSATTKVRKTLVKGGYEPPWEDETRVLDVLRAQGMVPKDSFPVIATPRVSRLAVPVGSSGNGIQRDEAREMADYLARVQEARFELERVNKSIVQEVKEGRRTDLADSVVSGALAALAKLRGT